MRSCLLAAFLLLDRTPIPAQPPIPVKVVVVTMFERGEDSGDDPGEFQYWVEREKLDQVYKFPQGNRDIRMNAAGVLGTVTGQGTAKAAAHIMALGLDPRFDLRKAYWIVAGIAGVNPAAASLGSAAWAEWIVDGDLAREIDAREIPAGWDTGFIPLGGSKPYDPPGRVPGPGEAYHLNPALTDWAFQLTQGVRLDATQAMRTSRESYSQPNARRAPFVLKGDVLSASTFWHGALMDRWANAWVKYETGGKGNFVMTAMEDSGTMQALTFLANAGRVDRERILVLRTASNFDQQAAGKTAAESLASGVIAFLPAIEAAWRVGSPVVHELTSHWDRYRDTIPQATH